MSPKMKNDFMVPDLIKQDIIQYFSGNLSEPASQRLLLWLNQSDEHRVFFDSLTAVWHSASTLGNMPEFSGDQAWQEIKDKIRQDEPLPANYRFLQVVKRYSRIAAALIILLGLGYALMYTNLSHRYKGSGNNAIEFNAPLGSRSDLVLPDGSAVWLNSGSRLKITGNYGISDRKVELTGEAYFKVAKNKKIPFVVQTSDVNITALGTAFNVKAYDDEPTIETTLEEGAVSIEAVGRDNSKATQILLKPNEKAIFRKNPLTRPEKNMRNNSPDNTINETVTARQELDVITLTDTKTITSWKEQRWIFRHESLSELARKLERRYNVEIVFSDTLLEAYAFNGTLYDESIEQVFEAIKLIAPIDFTIDHNTITIGLNSKLKEEYEGLLLK